MKWFSLFIGLVVAIYGQAQPAANKAAFEKNYQERIKQAYLNGQYIPQDLTDAFLELNKLMDAESKAAFKNVPEEEAVHKLYFSLGRWITENWGFYAGSRLSHYIRELGITFPEDMAAFIIVSYHRNLNRQELKVKEQVAFYQETRRKEHEARVLKGTVLKEETRKVAKN